MILNGIAGQGRYYPLRCWPALPSAQPRHGEFAALLVHCACSFAAILNFAVQLLSSVQLSGAELG
jgi:hypothetical protein